MKRLKILYRKNLKLSPGKLAAQCVHASRRMDSQENTPVIVLSVSDAGFEASKSKAKGSSRTQDSQRLMQELRLCWHFGKRVEIPLHRDMMMRFFRRVRSRE